MLVFGSMGPRLVGGRYADPFMPPFAVGICIPAAGAPILLCMSRLGLTKSLAGACGAGMFSRNAGNGAAGCSATPIAALLTGTDRE